MTYNKEKLGAFIVPTGIGASIGGYAGDAGAYAREFSKYSKLIVNPNVVNAGGFSAITPNMYYVEGYSLDSFFKGNINLVSSNNNKIGIIYDKAIPQEVLNIHLNTQNAVKVVYGIDIADYEITEKNVGVDFYITEDGISVGNIKNIETLKNSCEKLLNKGCDAIAIVCLFDDAEEENQNYSSGIGVDPVGGVEAIISHTISKEYCIPCAHSPAFVDFSITTDLINPKSASEYITPTFLPCILLGLAQAPKLTTNLNEGINISQLDYIVYPHNCLGGIPIYQSLKNGTKIYTVKENSTILNVTKANLFTCNENIIEYNTYKEVLNDIIGI